MTCPRCGHPDTTVELTPDGPHHGKQLCAGCGLHRGREPKPMTLERALSMVMPFGKHKGCTLGELPRDYLGWMEMDNVGSGSLRRAVECIRAARREGKN